MTRLRPLCGGLALALAPLVACAPTTPPGGTAEPSTRSVSHTIVPAPADIRLSGAEPFTITATTSIGVQPGTPDVEWIGNYLADILRPSTGFPLAVLPADGVGSSGNIQLRLGGDAALGDEGYRMEVSGGLLTLSANQPAGLFRGVQTLRQLLPPGIEAELSAGMRRMPLMVPAGTIVDQPRFAWRGAMLDVARHFFTVEEVKQYIDALTLYKINVLHLHLSDDQGWRIEIKSRPRLAQVGGSTQVGGGPGGYYTQEQYAEIVRYAQAHYMTVVPEIDLPGHTNAALIAYPELSCGTRPPALYTGTEVGFSTFCVHNEESYRLIEDVLRELASLTPGNFLHVGGDEVEALTDEEYAHFIERVQQIVTGLDKRMVGWEEITKARLLPTTLSQQWKSDSATAALQQGAKIILSPASRTYLDMKYDQQTEIGLTWAGIRDVQQTYDWDPTTFLAGVPESEIAGVEAPLWTETVKNITAAQYLAFPRLPAIAEIGWTPAPLRDWESFRVRLAAQAPRWHILGINYYRSPQVPWTQ